MAPPFSSPQGNAPQTLAALWCLVALALVFVLLRLYTRYKVIDAIGVDDHLFNVAFVSQAQICQQLYNHSRTDGPVSRTGTPGGLLQSDHGILLLRLRSNSRRCARSMASVTSDYSHKRRPNRRRSCSLGIKDRSRLFLAAHIRCLWEENSLDYHHPADSSRAVCDGWSPGLLARMPTNLVLVGPAESGWSMR